MGYQPTYRFTLPYPPSANSIWRNVVIKGQARTYLSTEARTYKLNAAKVALAAGCTPLDGDISMTLKVYRPRKVGDLGNREKILSDSLNGIAYHDDKQITEIHLYRFDDKSNARVEVEIHQITNNLNTDD
jgi:crossover junction endodeoxyribonuclease RusA